MVRVWDLENSREMHRMRGHSFTVFSLAFSPAGRLAISGSGDRTVRLWDVEQGRQVCRFGGFFSSKKSGPVEAVAFSPDGSLALSAGGLEDHTVRLWNVETGKEIRPFVGHALPAHSLAFFPDGRRAITASRDDTVRVWDLATGREIGRFEKEMEIACQTYADRKYPTIETFVMSSDGRRLLSATDYDPGVLYLFDLLSGRHLARLEGHSSTARVTSLGLSSDGRWAISGSDDWTVRVWDLRSLA